MGLVVSLEVCTRALTNAGFKPLCLLPVAAAIGELICLDTARSGFLWFCCSLRAVVHMAVSLYKTPAYIWLVCVHLTKKLGRAS
jgi:hypothetical protein